jgi:hypothetical protein
LVNISSAWAKQCTVKSSHSWKEEDDNLLKSASRTGILGVLSSDWSKLHTLVFHSMNIPHSTSDPVFISNPLYSPYFCTILNVIVRHVVSIYFGLILGVCSTLLRSTDLLQDISTTINNCEAFFHFLHPVVTSRLLHMIYLNKTVKCYTMEKL